MMEPDNGALTLGQSINGSQVNVEGDGIINYGGKSDLNANNEESNKRMEVLMGVYKNPKLIVPKSVTQSLTLQPLTQSNAMIREEDPIIEIKVARQKKRRFENVINDNQQPMNVHIITPTPQSPLTSATSPTLTTLPSPSITLNQHT
ncbi:hypothetical protein AAZX31_13G130700 [Glycine max]